MSLATGPGANAVQPGVTWVSMYAATANALIAAAPDPTILSLFAWHSGGVTLYLHLFNAAVVPGAGTTPIISIPIPVLPGACSLDISGLGWQFPAGLSVALSTTGPTYTATASLLWLSVAYRTAAT